MGKGYPKLGSIKGKWGVEVGPGAGRLGTSKGNLESLNFTDEQAELWLEPRLCSQPAGWILVLNQGKPAAELSGTGKLWSLVLNQGKPAVELSGTGKLSSLQSFFFFFLVILEMEPCLERGM